MTRAAPTTCAALRRFLSVNAVTQSQFAKSVGTTQQAVALWMRGKRTPRPEFMRRIFDETKGAVAPNDFLPPRRGRRMSGEWFHKKGAVVEFLRSLPPLVSKPSRMPSPLRRPVDLLLKWETIDSIAVGMGVQREAVKKWRRRGVPAAWQIKMVHEHPSLLSFDDFGTSVLIPRPSPRRAPAPEPAGDRPQRARDQGEREPNRQAFNYGHEGVR